MKNAPRNIIDSLSNSLDKLANKGNAPVSVADELIKLKSLLDSGAIKNDEYEKQKQKILN